MLVDGEAVRARTEALYRRHGRSVTRTCFVLLRDRGEAEDATQEVFFSAHRALLAGVEPREPAAWLATIARHECWARIRARMAAPTAVRPDAAEQATPVSPDAVRAAEVAALWCAIAELPQAQREALLLREVRGLSYDELAGYLAVSAPSIRSLLERARRRIRLRLRDVHTAVSGIPWLEAAARLVAGGSNPAAPVARMAALGIGAAALTGGAVLTPTALEHHVRPVVARQAAVPHRVVADVKAARRTSPRVAAAIPHTGVAVVDRRVRRDRGERRPAVAAERRGHHRPSRVGDGDGEGDGEGQGGSDGSGGSSSPPPVVPTAGNSSGEDASQASGGDSHSVEASGGDSHGGETVTTNSGPASVGAPSPVIAAPIVSSTDGGGDPHGDSGTSSGRSGDSSGGEGSSGSSGSSGSDGSVDSEGR